MSTIRHLFSDQRPIDRPIERVIDYYATDETRLAREVDEYVVTDKIEGCFRRFLDVYGQGVRTGDVTEIGIWVSGFYGSGKSSYTKYLGFALDPDRTIEGEPFLNRLCRRFLTPELGAQLRTLVRKHPTAVIMLDLGAEQLADTATAPVTRVLYWKVLQWAGYSKEKKIAHLEFALDEKGLLDKFREAYRKKFPGKGEWEAVHNDPLLAVTRADHLVPEFFRDDYPTPGIFRSVKFDEGLNARDLTERIIALVRRKSGHENMLFLIDEAGQYVAPRGELILNLDGFARNLKELGKGKVWIAATGQQTLAEIIEKSAYNSAELNKLRDRFPINIELDPRDIRQITHRRLLTKSASGEDELRDRFKKHGQAAINFTRLTGTALFKTDPDEDSFLRFYPFLPHHFDLLMELIRTLARSTGGIGLRSVIRVIQDLLVDVSRSLPPGQKPLADRPVGTLATADDFFDILRADIGKVLPHVVTGVEKVERVFTDDPLAVRVAKAVAALQPIENFPRSAENIAALLYPSLNAAGLAESVRLTLRQLVDEQECGIVEDPQAGGYIFLSEGIKVYRDKRTSYNPTSPELNQLRSQLLAAIFDPLPAALMENVRKVEAGIRYGKVPVAGEGNDVQFRIEPTVPSLFDTRREDLLTATASLPEWRNAIAWLVSFPEEVEDLLVNVRRSDFIIGSIPERDADKDVAQFLRSERRLLDTNKDRAQNLMKESLAHGLFVYRGGPLAAAEAGLTLDAACRTILGKAAEQIYPKFRLVPLRPSTELAAQFLAVDRLDRMPSDKDPLHFVKKVGNSYRVQASHPVLSEALKTFKDMVEASGSGRIQGKAIQDAFADAPYLWTKDAIRYVFAGLFRAGELELHTAEGTLATPGPKAVEAFKSAVAFGRVGVSLRDVKPPLEALDRAASRLESLFAIEVLPLEDHVSRAVRNHFPAVLEQTGSLPARLRLLGLPGQERAQLLLETCADLLKEDASGATMLLGAKECAIPADVDWARAVAECLSAGAEKEIQRATEVLAAVEELAALFPDEHAALLAEDDRQVIHDTLRSQNFHERLPDLRGALNRLLERLRGLYAQRKEVYEGELGQAKDKIESMPEWFKLSPEDRQDIGSRLASADLPEAARAGREVADVRLLLVRRAGIPRLSGTLQQEVRKRLPQAATVEPTPGVETIALRELAPENVLKTAEDLEAWLAAIREQLLPLLSTGKKHLRIAKD